MATNNLTAKVLRELFYYNPDLGFFVRKVRISDNSKVGEIAGGVRSNGYRYISIHNKSYLESRLAWLYMHGQWPKNYIDHIDGNPLNNAIHNLRDVTQSQNLYNQLKPQKNNSTGFLGVVKDSRRSINRFTAQIRVKGKSTHIGTFDTPEEAHAAYLSAKHKLMDSITNDTINSAPSVALTASLSSAPPNRR